MTQIVVSQPLLSQLGNVVGPVEFVDEQGRRLGHFVPHQPFADVGCLHTADELQKMRSETGGRPLAEIWKSLGAK